MTSKISDRLRGLAARYEAQVGRDRAEELTSRALARARNTRPRWHVPAAVVAVGLTVVGFLMLGTIADPSSPGQLLYPVDRAYEQLASAVGVGAPRSQERLAEAIDLMDRGQEVEAAALIAEALTLLEDEIGLTAADPAALPELDPTTTLRGATEELLSTVQAVSAAGGQDTEVLTLKLQIAAAEVAAAARAVIEAAEPVGEETATSSTTTTTTSSTTTTTTTTPSTTTTTAPSTTTTTAPDDGGPIILPPQP
jgi:hypothetical protein